MGFQLCPYQYPFGTISLRLQLWFCLLHRPTIFRRQRFLGSFLKRRGNRPFRRSTWRISKQSKNFQFNSQHKMDLIELVINELMVTYLQFGVFRINCTGIGFGGSQITWCYTRFSGAGFHMFGDFDFLLVGECLKNASVKLAQN